MNKGFLMSNNDVVQLSYNYDSEVDALTLRAQEEYQYSASLEVNPNLIIDVSTDKKVMAFEILDAKHYFEIDGKYLDKADFSITVTVNEDVIKSEFILITMDNQTRKAYRVSSKAINEEYVENGLFKYVTIGV